MNLCVCMWENGHAQVWCACEGQRSTLACWSMPSILWGQGLFPVSCCLCNASWFVGLQGFLSTSHVVQVLGLQTCSGLVCMWALGITHILRTSLYVSPRGYRHAQDLSLCESLGLQTCLRTLLYVSPWGCRHTQTCLYVSPWGYRHTQDLSVCEFLGFKLKSSHLQGSVYPLSHLPRSLSLNFSCLYLPTSGIIGICYIPGLCGSGA